MGKPELELFVDDIIMAVGGVIDTILRFGLKSLPLFNRLTITVGALQIRPHEHFLTLLFRQLLLAL
jgi:hypothetical protein